MSLNDLILANAHCTICGAKGVGTCDCWELCSCGWTKERGKLCPGPAHARNRAKKAGPRQTIAAGVLPVDKDGVIK